LNADSSTAGNFWLDIVNFAILFNYTIEFSTKIGANNLIKKNASMFFKEVEAKNNYYEYFYN